MGSSAGVDSVKAPPKEQGPWWFKNLGSGWSTLFLIGLVVTISQFLAMRMAGLELPVLSRAWSSGGILAVTSALIMWRLAKGWRVFRTWIWLPLAVASLLTFAVIGFQNNYSVEVIDQEAKPATQSLQATGNYHVESTTNRICEPDEDYFACINAHVAAYNSVCVEHSLSFNGNRVCSAMFDFIEQMKTSYEGCGYGCRTQGEYGNWGWAYLRLEPEMTMASNNDAQPRKSHKEHCSFDLGVIKLGTCVREGS